MDSRFEAEVVLITGATSGVGEAVAVRLAAEGAVVVPGARGGGAADSPRGRAGAAGAYAHRS
jgi:NADP-dependent 3-hydroxy acid dehydrogenase YdfG